MHEHTHHDVVVLSHPNGVKVPLLICRRPWLCMKHWVERVNFSEMIKAVQITQRCALTYMYMYMNIIILVGLVDCAVYAAATVLVGEGY